MAKQISIIKLSCCVKFWNDKLFFSLAGFVSLSLYITFFSVPLLSSSNQTIWEVKECVSAGKHGHREKKEWKKRKSKKGRAGKRHAREEGNENINEIGINKKNEKYSVLLKLRQIKSIHCAKYKMNKINTHTQRRPREWCVMNIRDQAAIVRRYSIKREKLTENKNTSRHSFDWFNWFNF